MNKLYIYNYGRSLGSHIRNTKTTLSEVARLTGTHPKSISRIIKGKVTPPRHVIEKINVIFNSEILKKQGETLLFLYGDKGSSRTPMGITPTKFSQKTKSSCPTNTSLGFNVEMVASKLNISPTELVNTINQYAIQRN